jgi:hypothetical protein
MRILSGLLGARTVKQPPERPRLIWLENEFEIYRRASAELSWLSPFPYPQFWHPTGQPFVTIWPLRMMWSLWWMAPRPFAAASAPNPRVPADLATLLQQHPPKDPDTWPSGSLVDHAALMLMRRDEPRQVPDRPILETGTQLRAGRFMSDFCDGFDSQLVLVTSGLWTGTLLDLRVGRAGEPYLIARLGIVPPADPIVADPDRAARLLDQLRDVEASNPS